MKTLLFVIAAGFLSLNAIEDLPNKYAGHYCAEMNDGIFNVVHEGGILDADVKLANGTTVKTDGTIIANDGSIFMMSIGDCVDHEGYLSDSEPDSILENSNK